MQTLHASVAVQRGVRWACPSSFSHSPRHSQRTARFSAEALALHARSSGLSLSALSGRRCTAAPATGALSGRQRGSGVGKSTGVQCSLIQKVSAAELDALLNAEERKLPLVIDFYATWCGPCVILAQQLEKLAIEYHGVAQFVKVDTDEEYELANQLQIRGLPTLVFVSKEKEKLAKRTEGVLPVEVLKDLIEGL